MTDQAPDDDRTVVRPTTARPAPTGFQATSLDMQPTLASGGPPPRPAPEDDMGNGLPVGTRLGEFEITRLVGEGGFGIVYEAIDHSLGRHVALKEYMPSALAARNANSQVQVRSERHRETFEAGRKSFVNEARLLASFDHPALVKVYRFWEGNGTAYMVMQFLEGKTLRDILREQRQAGLPPPDESWLRSVLGPLTEALLVIHGEQCYHRDIAPDNVMQLANGRWLLLDFGAARRVIGDMTQALTVILKPGYAPIEQYAEIPGMKQGAWTDVYALAAVVYFAIMGRTPPPSVSRMLNDTYQPLAQAAAGRYGEPFLRAIDRALAVRPEERTQTIGELRQQLGLGDAALDPLAALPPVPGGTLPAAAAGADAPATPSASAQAAAAAAMPRAAPAAPLTPPPTAAPPAAPAGKRRGAALGIGIGIGAVLLAALGLGVYSFVAPGGMTHPAAPSASAAAAAGPASAAPAVVAAAPAASAPAPAAEPSSAPAPPAAATVPAAPPAFDTLRELERVVAGQTPGFVVRAETPKSVLRIGKDEFRFSVTSERDGYLTVLGLAPEGTLARLVPNQRSGVVRLKKGQTWRFPAGDGFVLDTQDPPGPTQLLLIVSASARSFDALEPETSGPVQVFPPRDALAALAARQDAAAPPLAGRARCSAAAACPEDYGAALLRYDTVH
ncbi:MAG: serine/threonine-protein kinase [Rubrivivax sp.]